MHIGLVYNQRPEGFNRNDPKLEKHIEGDEQKTINAINLAISSHGHKVTNIVCDKTIYHSLESIKNEIDLIFNLSEGLSNTQDREAQVPLIAEMLGIPYTGPSPLSAALILNKYRSKQIWTSQRVRTAQSQLFTNPSTKLSPYLKYPLIVKPNSDGSGIGIHDNSIVKTDKELRQAIKRINNYYLQDALVESFLPGREFTVAIIGNGDNLVVLPIIEINFKAMPQNTHQIDSYEAKFVYGVTGQADATATEFCPAQIPELLEKKIVELCKKAYTSIGCRDFGRLDVRLDDQGIPHILEINYPPGLMSDPNESSFFTIAGRAHGWSFEQMIGYILATAVTRLKL